MVVSGGVDGGGGECCGAGGDCFGDGVGSRGATCLRRREDIDSSRPPLASRLWLVFCTK